MPTSDTRSTDLLVEGSHFVLKVPESGDKNNQKRQRDIFEEKLLSGRLI